MQRKLKRPFALMLALFTLMTSVGNRELFVSAEETEDAEVISVMETQEEETFVFADEQRMAASENAEADTEAETTAADTGAALETVVRTETTVAAETEMTLETVTPDTETTSDAVTKNDTGEMVLTTDADETTMETGEEETEEGLTEGEILMYTPVVQPDSVSVVAYVKQGVLPDGTYMMVSELSEGTNAYHEAEKTLEAHHISFDGFKAMDITFYNAEGQIIEPEEGTVQVHMTLNAEVLPEEADPDTIAVQHHDASTGDVQIETVAEVTTGTVAVSDAEVVAEFSVGSFSTFTITWSSGYKKYFEITVHYVNTNGDELDEADHADMTLKAGDTIVFSDLKENVSGLTYKEARYDDAIRGNVVTSMQAFSDTESGFMGYEKKYNKVTFYNGEAMVKTLSYRTDRYGNSQTQKADIYLIYQTATATPSAPEIVRSLSKSKTATLNTDGTYDLNLTVSGAVGSQSNPAYIDVLLIIDKSGSMAYSMNQEKGTASPNRRIDKVADAVKQLTDTFDKNTQNIDVRYSAVAFSNSSKSYVIQAWTESSSDLNTAVKQIKPDGGTNYQKGLILGKQQLNQSRQGAEKIVIFLSDGLPTRREPSSNGGEEGGNGQDDNDSHNINAAVEEIKGLSANQFYCIGIGPAFQKGSSESTTAKENLNKLCANVLASKTAVYTPASVEDLLNAFASIAGNATRFLCSHVTVTDTLSENVEAVLDGDGKVKKLQVTVTDAQGNTYGPSETVTLPKTENNEEASISSTYANGDLKMLFPEDYELEQDWTYQVTMTVRATEKAYENYRTNALSYSDYGEANTGTHSGQAGFRSNTLAKVDYTYNGESKTENYDHPVIQLHPGTLVIEKTVSGLDEDAIALLEQQMMFEITIKEQSSQVLLSQFTKTDGKYMYLVEGLSPDTTYEVKELYAELDGFDLTANAENTSGTVEEDGTQTASFTNEYTPSYLKLTVRKKVDGTMGDRQHSFAFTLTATKNGQPYTENIDGLTLKNGVYSFALKHDESITFELPYGCDFELSEQDDKQGYETTYAVDKGTALDSKSMAMSGFVKDTEVVFTNIKNAKTPTGLVSNNVPFLIMIVLSAVGACLVWTGYRKRRRF